MKGLIKSALLGTLLCTSVCAEEPEVVILAGKQTWGFINEAMLVVRDAVKGGCWTNVKQVEQNARLKLEQSGIAVAPEIKRLDPRLPQAAIIIVGQGWKEGDGCVGQIYFQIIRKHIQQYANVFFDITEELMNDSFLATCPTTLNEQISSFVDQEIAEFAADVIKYRRDPDVRKAMKNFAIQSIDDFLQKNQ